MDRLDHNLNGEMVSILDQVISQSARKFLQTWFSDKSAISRHIEKLKRKQRGPNIHFWNLILVGFDPTQYVIY